MKVLSSTALGKRQGTMMNSVLPKSVYELMSQKRKNNDFETLFNDVSSNSNENSLIVSNTVNWLMYSIISSCINYTKNSHYNLITRKHKHIIRIIVKDCILVGSVKEKLFLNGSKIVAEKDNSKYYEWIDDVTAMAKSVTINVLSKWKEMYNLRIQEKSNILISVGIRKCKLPPLTTTIRLLYSIIERVKLNEKKNINNEKKCKVKNYDDLIIID